MSRARDGQAVLVADVGATKTVLALYPAMDEAMRPQPVALGTYPSRDHGSFVQTLDLFLEGDAHAVVSAAIAVAGPVVRGRPVTVNLPWDVDVTAVADRLGTCGITLLNDVEALAWAVPCLEQEGVSALDDAERMGRGAIAVVAPGTGLGEAFLTWEGSRYVAHPSEGGHVDFAPAGHDQIGLLTYLSRAWPHVSAERVCSGMGIQSLLMFLCETSGSMQDRELCNRLRLLPDSTPRIIEAAMSGESLLCLEAIRLFVEILGAECGNFALKVMATGGVFLGGGIPPRIIPLLRDGSFRATMVGKGRLRPILESIPVFVITEPHAVLHGAVRCAEEALWATER